MTETQWALIWVVWGVGIAEILDYFSITWEGLIILTVMLLLDFIFWIVDAQARGERIESRKWQVWLVKKITRRMLPFIVAGWLKWTDMPWIETLIIVILWMIIFSELYSIIWHIYSINYKEQLPEVDAFKMLLNSLTKLLKNLIKKENDKIDNLPSNQDENDWAKIESSED